MSILVNLVRFFKGITLIFSPGTKEQNKELHEYLPFYIGQEYEELEFKLIYYRGEKFKKLSSYYEGYEYLEPIQIYDLNINPSVYLFFNADILKGIFLKFQDDIRDTILEKINLDRQSLILGYPHCDALWSTIHPKEKGIIYKILKNKNITYVHILDKEFYTNLNAN